LEIYNFIASRQCTWVILYTYNLHYSYSFNSIININCLDKYVNVFGNIYFLCKTYIVMKMQFFTIFLRYIIFLGFFQRRQCTFWFSCTEAECFSENLNFIKIERVYTIKRIALYHILYLYGTCNVKIDNIIYQHIPTIIWWVLLVYNTANTPYLSIVLCCICTMYIIYILYIKKSCITLYTRLNPE